MTNEQLAAQRRIADRKGLSHSEQQAKAQLESIREMVAALSGEWRAEDIDDKRARTICHLSADAPVSDADREATAAELNSTESGWDKRREDAEETIQQDPLSVEVRSGWYSFGARDADTKPAEFMILLRTGGPACRIVGNLSEYGEPESARIEHQDWGTPWTEYRITKDEEADVLTYCRQFYFGD